MYTNKQLANEFSGHKEEYVCLFEVYTINGDGDTTYCSNPFLDRADAEKKAEIITNKGGQPYIKQVYIH